MADVIFGRNPVIEALKSGREIEKVLISSAEGSAAKIVAMAKERKIPLIRTEKRTLDKMAAGAVHQGVAAYISSYAYKDVDDILKKASDAGEEPFVVILDNIEDPHYL